MVFLRLDDVCEKKIKQTNQIQIFMDFFLINIVIVLRYTILCLFFTSAQVEGSFKQIYNPCTVGIFKVLLYITLNGFFGNGR